MATKHTIAIVLISILILMAIAIFLIGLSNYYAYETCNTVESPTCFVVTCGQQTQTCGDYAYRCLGNGKAMCSSNPGVVKDINSLDGICTS